MPLVPTDTLREFQAKALELRLDRKRDLMLSTLPVNFVAQLRTDPNLSDQLAYDLAAFNMDLNLRIIGDACPMVEWLRSAAVFSSNYPDTQAYFTGWANTIAEMAARRGPQQGEHARNAGDVPDLPERIIHQNDLLPAGFLEGALAASRAVVRLVVPVFRGDRRVSSDEGTAWRGYGTGWLIGPRYLLTNHHVIANRSPGAPVATDSEFALQGANAVAEFDYLSEEQGSGRDVPIVRVAASDPVLDYALLELAEAITDRAPLTLARDPLVLDGDDHPAVNIIQHPRGAPKHVALRNNLVAALRGNDLAYYADTEAGSSGSPVADDRWRVLALHKASTLRFHKMEFQGKPTAWVNVGTPIHLIRQHIERTDAALWADIGVRLA